MYHFCINILKAISLKRFTFGICAYFKVGLPALTMFLLCFVFKSSLLAQESLQNTATREKLYYFALKNNLLYDDALLPNSIAKVYLGKQFLFAIEDNRSWSVGASPVWLFGNENSING